MRLTGGTICGTRCGFREAMGALYGQGYRVFLEIGPTPILVEHGEPVRTAGRGRLAAVAAPGPQRLGADAGDSGDDVCSRSQSGLAADWIRTIPAGGSRCLPMHSSASDMPSKWRRVNPGTTDGGNPPACGRQEAANAGSGREIAAGRVVGIAQRSRVDSASCAFSTNGTKWWRKSRGSREFRVFRGNESENRAELNDWLYKVEWEPQILAQENGASSGGNVSARKWLIFADSHGVGRVLGIVAERAGRRVCGRFGGRSRWRTPTARFSRSIRRALKKFRRRCRRSLRSTDPPGTEFFISGVWIAPPANICRSKPSRRRNSEVAAASCS